MKWLLLFLLAVPIVGAQDFIGPITPRIIVEGECGNYNVTMVSNVFRLTEYECVDAKIGVTNSNGENMEIWNDEWKSSFFYLGNDFCRDSEGAKIYQIRTDNSASLQFVGKIRNGETVYASDVQEIIQSCPEVKQLDNRTFWVVSLVVILILVALITLYTKH